MPAKEETCYAFIQLPDTFEWVVCGVLTVRGAGQDAYRGIFQYGRSYLARPNDPSLDPYNLPLSDRPQESTKLKGSRDALMLERFDRQWHPDASAYARFGLVSGLTVLDAEDGYLGRDRWSYPLLADELRRWSSHPEQDRMELFRRMVFNAMVTNNDDHPRNHAMLQVEGGWRLSPAYDIVPVPAMSKKRRDPALQVGTFGRAASIYNLLSQPEVFGLSVERARAQIDRMREKVSCWRDIFKKHGVSSANIDAITPAMLPESFERTEPPGPI